MLQLKFTSPLEKFLPAHTMSDVRDYTPYPILCGESFAVHAVFCDTESFLKSCVRVKVECDGAEVLLYRVDLVPVRVPCYPEWHDDDYMSFEAGLFPDIMTKIDENTLLYAPQKGLEMLRLEIPSLPAGEHHLTLTLEHIDGESKHESCNAELDISVLDAKLPEQKTVVMQFLHTDCIAEYYNVPAMSDRYFELVERWARTAVENGVNCLYTPLFTPPLDTEVGGERLTVQLIGVTKRDGEWSFDLSLLDRWIDMGLRIGVEYFEFSHLFTQWGARHAPKIMANVDGEMRRVFGWETDAASDEYVGFLRKFIKELLSHMKERGLYEKCIFHISDEPNEEQKDAYRSAMESVGDLLADCTVADAMGDVSFYTEGICRRPIPGTNNAKKFLPYIPEDLWVYYCCGQTTDVSNRFIAMPLSRVRIIGLQMWKSRCTGFLHWGYNFYKSQYSRYSVDPYRITDADYFAPAGDAFSVYPGEDGEAVPSLRLRTFYEALCDIRALEAAESKFGREAVEKLLEYDGGELALDSYPRGGEYIENVRHRLAKLLES